MAVVSTGPISLLNLQTEFGGPASPMPISSYYSGGTYVPTNTRNKNSVIIPTSGQVSFSDYYGSRTGAPSLLTATSARNWTSQWWPNIITGTFDTSTPAGSVEISSGTNIATSNTNGTYDLLNKGGFFDTYDYDSKSYLYTHGRHAVTIKNKSTGISNYINYFTQYWVWTPNPDGTTDLTVSYTVKTPFGVPGVRMYIEMGAAGGGGGSGNGPGENWSAYGGGGGGGQTARGFVDCYDGEKINFTIGRQGYGAPWYSYDYPNQQFGTANGYYNTGALSKAGYSGNDTTLYTSSGSINITLKGGSGAGGRWAGGAGGSGGTKSGPAAANFTILNGAAGNNSGVGGNSGGYGVSGYLAAGAGGPGPGGTYYDPNTTSYYSSSSQYQGYRGGVTGNRNTSYNGLSGGGGGGWGNVEGGSGNGCGGPGAPGYVLIAYA